MRHIIRFLLCFAIVWFLVPVETAGATSCPKTTIIEKLNDADLVFEGRHISRGKNWIKVDMQNGRGYVLINEFKIDRLLKGAPSGSSVEAIDFWPVTKIAALPQPGDQEYDMSIEGLIFLNEAATPDGKNIYISSTCSDVLVPTGEERKIIETIFPKAAR